MPNVVVAVATFRRPAELARVLPALVEQVGSLSSAHQASIVVVDNDPQAGARAQVAAFAAALVGAGPLVTYVHEPAPGIAAARNAALDHALSAGAHALTFIDDDEEPQPGWLTALIATWQHYGCAVVTGPVVSVHAAGVDPWVLGTGVFATVERPTGQLVNSAATNNVLFELVAMRRTGARFDQEFGLSGGSDTMLTHLLRSKGEQVRWCAEALVWDHIPASRATRQWVLARTVRTSNTWSRVAVQLAAGNRVRLTTKRAELTARGGYRLARGSLTRAKAWVDGHRGRDEGAVAADARGATDQASGLGILLGAYGIVRYEYRRTS